MININSTINMAAAKLKEMYGDDFKLEDGDEFVFTLNNAVLILSQNGTDLGVNIIMDPAIPLDIDVNLE